MILLRCDAPALINIGSLLSLVFVMGCQTYEPKPLDLSTHAAHWEARTPDSEKVTQFALRLKEHSAQQKTVFDPTDGLTLSEGEVVALVYNPDLRMTRLKAKVTQAKAQFTGLWQDPVFNLNILKIKEAIPDPWYISSSLSLTIPISGRIGAEKSLAEAEVITEWHRIAESEWQIIRDLRKSWLSWSALNLKKDQTEVIIQDLDAIIRSTRLLADAGELLKTEAALFVIERDTKNADLELLKANLAEEEQQIRSLMGLSPRAPLTLIPSISLDFKTTEPSIHQNRNPTLIRLNSEYEVAEKSLLREIRKQYPDLTIGPQAETDGGQSRIGFVGGIPLPLLNSNKGVIAEARAQRELSQAAYETEFERLNGHLAALQARLIGIQTRRRAMEQVIVPMIDQQISDTNRLLELGEGGTLVMLESLSRAYEIKLKLIEAQLECALTHNNIQFTVGPPVPVNAKSPNQPLP